MKAAAECCLTDGLLAALRESTPMDAKLLSGSGRRKHQTPRRAILLGSLVGDDRQLMEDKETAVLWMRTVVGSPTFISSPCL